MAQFEFVKRQGKSLKAKEHTMKCAICNKILGTLIETEKKSKILTILTKYCCIYSSDKCNCESFVVKTLNECAFLPSDGLKIKNNEFDIKEKHVDYRIILEKIC